MSFRTRIRAGGARRNITSASGMVLVMVLAALAVMTILLVSLLVGASHQIFQAQADASEAREKMLADSAVALVMGQIQQASTQTNQAWISQPGLLRTYSTTRCGCPRPAINSIPRRACQRCSIPAAISISSPRTYPRIGVPRPTPTPI